MMNSGLPISTIMKKAKEEGDIGTQPKKRNREEWKKEQELEELRKAGSAPAAVDEEGKDINPHIPQYIMGAPWYYATEGPTLKHQRPQEDRQKYFTHLNEHYVRGVQGIKAKKWRKGACENCGAMGHTKKECVERPRKVGARFTNAKIAADDVELPTLALDFDGKRDRWNGFDPSQYKNVIEEHAKVENCKRRLKAKKLQEGDEGVSSDEAEEDFEDEDKYAELADMPGTKVDSKQRITVRNLRIREDTAKYLRNLDPDSAHYDPKTRAMRVNPYKDTGKNPEEVDYAGENFIRYTGDTLDQARAQKFAWEAHEQGVDVSLLAEPTKVELLQKEYEKRKDAIEEKTSNSLLKKYGGEEHLKVPPKEMLLAQSEEYREYSRQGKVIKGEEPEGIKSRYEEDVLINNHIMVWGSYWSAGQWGYRCCHSFTKNSYCTGEAGKTYVPEADISSVSAVVVPEPSAAEESDEEEVPKTLVEEHLAKLAKKKKSKKSKKNKHKKSKKRSSEDDDDSASEDEEAARKRKLREALIKAKIEEEEGKKLLSVHDRDRKYNISHNTKTLTEEEVEAYQMRRQRDDDPMAKF